MIAVVLRKFKPFLVLGLLLVFFWLVACAKASYIRSVGEVGFYLKQDNSHALFVLLEGLNSDAGNSRDTHYASLYALKNFYIQHLKKLAPVEKKASKLSPDEQARLVTITEELVLIENILMSLYSAEDRDFNEKNLVLSALEKGLLEREEVYNFFIRSIRAGLDEDGSLEVNRELLTHGLEVVAMAFLNDRNDFSAGSEKSRLPITRDDLSSVQKNLVSSENEDLLALCHTALRHESQSVFYAGLSCLREFAIWQTIMFVNVLQPSLQGDSRMLTLSSASSSSPMLVGGLQDLRKELMEGSAFPMSSTRKMLLEITLPQLLGLE